MTVESEHGRKMTREEAGRKGGQKVAQERGSKFYREIGRKGGKKAPGTVVNHEGGNVPGTNVAAPSVDHQKRKDLLPIQMPRVMVARV